MCLCLKVESGQKQDASTMKWEDSAWLGEFMTLNTGVSPSEELGSDLSSILEDSALPKYFMSQKGCKGILDRSVRKNKPLHPILKHALIKQAGLTDEDKDTTGTESD